MAAAGWLAGWLGAYALLRRRSAALSVRAVRSLYWYALAAYDTPARWPVAACDGAPMQATSSSCPQRSSSGGRRVQQRRRGRSAGSGSGARGNTRVRCVTWNVGSLSGSFYKPELLPPLLLGDSPSEVEVLVVGLQEVEMTTKAFLSAAQNFRETDNGRRWKDTIMTALRQYGFALLKSSQVMGQLTLLFTIKSLLAAVVPRSIETASVGTGIMGTGYNKGSLAVRLQLGSQTWAFANCHFAAGHTEVQKRNDDYHTIVR